MKKKLNLKSEFLEKLFQKSQAHLLEKLGETPVEFRDKLLGISAQILEELL